MEVFVNSPDEIIKIGRAIDEFSIKMYYRMRTKMLEGFTGWGEEGDVSNADIRSRMLSKAALINPIGRDLVDIANYAMILYIRRPDEERDIPV